MKKTGIAIISILVTVLLAACGGGGGGGGFPAITPPPAGAITISTVNAEQVSAEVIGAIDTLEGGSSGVGLLTGVAVNQNGNGFRFSDFIVSQLDRFDVIKQQQLSSGITGVVIGPVTEACDSGSVTTSGDVADPTGNTLSTGDTLSLDFNNCSLFGTVFHGGLDLVINAVTPDPYDGVTLPYDLDISVVLTNLYVVEGGITLGSDGDMRLELSEDISGNHHEVLSGNSLVANLNGVAESLENYNYDLSYNDFTGDYTIVISGIINTTTLGGSVTFFTNSAFTGDDFFATGDHPTAGVLEMLSDSDPSQAILNALSDGINLLIEVDTDGNGFYEGMVPTTWAILESL